MVTRAGGVAKEELLLNRFIVSALQDENVLEICFATIWVYLTLLN